MNSKFVKTMLFAFLTVGLAVSCAPRSSGGNTPGGDTPGGDTPGGDTPGGDTPGGDTPGGDTPGGDTPGGDTPGGDPGDVTSFPVDDIKAFFAGYEIDIQNLPSYATASEKANFETDDSFEGYFDVYVNDTTSAELVAYKNALKTAGWTVVSADEETSEDFKLKYGETDAYADLLDFTTYVEEGEAPYNLVSFYVKSGSGELSYTAASAIDAVGELMSTLLESTIPTHHDLDGDYIIVNFGNSATVEQVKAVSENYFVPAGFEKSIDWKSASFSDGTPVEYIGFLWENIALEFDVFEESGNENPNYDGVYFQASASEVEAPVELDSINDTLAQFLEDAGIEATLPDLSAFDQYVTSYDLDPTDEDGFGVSAYVYFDDSADIFEALCAAFEGWSSEEGSYGYNFSNPEKTVTVSVNYLFGITYMVVRPYVEPEPSKPADWGDYESLTGFITAFLSARGVEGHTVPDLSDYEDNVVEYYGTSFSADGISLYIDGNVIEDVLDAYEAIGYTNIPTEPNESGIYELLSNDELVFSRVGYSSLYKQTFIYIYSYADVYVEPVDYDSFNDALADFISRKEITGFSAPNLSSFDDDVLGYELSLDKEDTYDYLKVTLEGDLVNDVLTVLDESGWDVPEQPTSYGYECVDANELIEADVDILSSGNTIITFYSYADLYPSVDADGTIANFLSGFGITTEFPSLAGFDVAAAQLYTSDELDVYIYGDVVEDVSALFEGWTHSTYGTTEIYESADGCVEVDIYYVSYYGATIIEIYANEPVTPPSTEWPAEDIVSFMNEYGFDGTVPAYSGDYLSVELTDYSDHFDITLELPEDADADDAIATYIADLGESFTPVDENTYTNGAINIKINSYFGYMFISVYAAESAGTTYDSFPSDLIAEFFPDTEVPSLDGASIYEGSGETEFGFSEVMIAAAYETDAEALEAYNNYLGALEAAGFTPEYGSYISSDRAIMIDVTIEDNIIYLDIYTNFF